MISTNLYGTLLIIVFARNKLSFCLLHIESETLEMQFSFSKWHQIHYNLPQFCIWTVLMNSHITMN